MRRPLVAGNWKRNGSQQSAVALTQALVVAEHTWDDVEVVLFPPFVHLLFCQIRLAESNIRFGGQTVSAHDNGAYTGEISASMLADLGAHYVLIGHSERRQYFGEDNKTLEKQCDRAMSAGLAPMLCVGETLAQRERNETLAVIQEQLAVVSRLKDNCADLTKIVIAYEPVWAIGTGKTASPEEAQTVHAAIRAYLREMNSVLGETTRILYGGSVKPDNAAALFAMPDIDGALVGGASLDVGQFTKILVAARS